MQVHKVYSNIIHACTHTLMCMHVLTHTHSLTHNLYTHCTHPPTHPPTHIFTHTHIKYFIHTCTHTPTHVQKGTNGVEVDCDFPSPGSFAPADFCLTAQQTSELASYGAGSWDLVFCKLLFYVTKFYNGLLNSLPPFPPSASFSAHHSRRLMFF